MARKPEFQHGIRRGQIFDWPADVPAPAEIASRVHYTGSTLHKSYESPAGPPAIRKDKARCDQYDLRDWPQLTRALQEAVRSGCVSGFRGEFPFRAWAWINGVLHEARLTNEGTGEYHGFPINDPRQYPEPRSRLEEAAPRVQIPRP